MEWRQGTVMMTFELSEGIVTLEDRDRDWGNILDTAMLMVDSSLACMDLEDKTFGRAQRRRRLARGQQRPRRFFRPP